MQLDIEVVDVLSSFSARVYAITDGVVPQSLRPDVGDHGLSELPASLVLP
jgi:hypothetical protein